MDRREPFRHVDAEERTAQQPEEDRHHAAQRGEPRSLAHHAGLAVPGEHPGSQECQDGTVAGVVQADAKEKHVERGEERREIHRAIFRPGIHVAHQFENAREPVILELHGRIVLRRRVSLEINDVGIRFQQGVDLVGGLLLGPALHDDQRTVGGLLRRGFHAHALQALLQLRSVRRKQLLRRRHAREFSVECPQFLPRLGDTAFRFAEVHRRSLHLLRIERHILARGRHGNEIGRRIGTVDQRKHIAFRPLGPELVVVALRGEEIAQHDALRSQRLRTLGRELAPRTQLVGRFLQASDLGGERRGLLVCGDIVLIGLGTRGEGFRTGLETTFPGTEIPQEVGGLRMPLDIEQQLPVFLRRLPARRRDVDKAQFAQLPDKILTLGRIEHKVVFCHFRYHNIAPSPACCCLVFTIFWADLERFSSSSMKRLILRMASSYPGICTFSYKFTF